MNGIHLSALACSRRLEQINKLSPDWMWGAFCVSDAVQVLNRYASRLLEQSDQLNAESLHNARMGEDLQAAQLRRTASQIEALAARIRREAGTAAWPNHDNPTVDLAAARPVTAQ